MLRHSSYLSICSLVLLQPPPVHAQVTEQGGSPPILLPAYASSVADTLTVQAQNTPTRADLTAGLLLNPEHPNLQISPSVDIQNPTKSGNDWITPITLTGLIPFGNSTVPIYFQGKKVETLHLLKSGLSLDSLPTTQQENNPLLLVLQNPSGFSYTTVRARLRFGDRDVCTFSVERFPDHKASPQAISPTKDCDDVTAWTVFEIPQYAGVSLRATPLHEWFTDNGTGLSRTVKEKGTLTLRYFRDPLNGQAQPIQEQTLPLEIEFQPGTFSRVRGYFLVGLYLLIGAIFSILIRVAIPNYRLFSSLKDQLIEIRKIARGISEEVDSMLRVQLRVERLSLDTLRKSIWVISPGFIGVAQRVEAGTATLRRRIDYVRRLDAALNRKRLLIADELAPPSRIAAIDRRLNAASEELKSDQFREEDWVFIQQALEAADKTLSDPSEEEKSAFETLLAQRWKSISGHFGYRPDRGWTLVPAALSQMLICFPEATALPLQDDADGSRWIKEIGTVRADLQISALELIREFEFLAPAQITDHWIEAMQRLVPWLATPALENLDDARSLLRQLSEGITALDIIASLQNGEAQIELDPQSVGTGERVHLAVRFRRPSFNSAAARQQILCEWHIQGFDGVRQSGTPETEATQTQPASTGLTRAAQKPSRDPLYYREKGWDIYHYFENVSNQCPLDVLFYFNGRPLTKNSADPSEILTYSYVIDLHSESVARKAAARRDLVKRTTFEALELFAALLVPLSALAVSTADQGSSGNWWQLIGLGFGSDTIRNVLSATSDSTTTKQK